METTGKAGVSSTASGVDKMASGVDIMASRVGLRTSDDSTRLGVSTVDSGVLKELSKRKPGGVGIKPASLSGSKVVSGTASGVEE